MTVTSPQLDEPADPSTSRRRWPPLWWRRFRLLPRTLRVSSYVVVALVLVLVASLLAGVVVVRRSFPQTTGELELAGLTADVQVVRDEHGIPQIYADTTEDLMRAQGFVHAQERFFEMDVRRHATAGRLAELFGEDAVETDAYVRTMGWRRVAEAELPLLDPDTRVALDAYAAGVNAYLDDRALGAIALEYAVLDVGGLDYRPEPWTAVDSLAWLKAMAWDLRGNMTEEIDRALSTAAVGEERTAALFPPYPYAEHDPIVKQGAVVDGVFEQDATTGGTRNPVRPPFGPGGQVADRLGRLAAGLDRMPAWLGRGDGLGSNSWVVSGEHTDTGAPLLANDPHLGVSMPGVWMQVGLHCRSVGPACPYDVAGFSFSGVPGVIIGHNADIAWGFTNLGPDVTDLYVEQVVGDRWRYRGRLRDLEIREETIEVAGGDDVTITVRSTRHGPILSDVDDLVADVGLVAAAENGAGDGVGDGAGDGAGGPGGGTEYAVSLSWTALTPAPTADAVLGLNRASDWDTFRTAVADFAAPAQNIVYADREGHIGYQAPGRIPIRVSGNDGMLPSAGWRPENDWTGEYVPFDGLPSVLDPAEGFVVTANQAVTDRRYPYFLGEDWDTGYRSDRIRHLLEDELADGSDGSDGSDESDESDEGGTVSAEEMLDVQLDDRNPLAPVLVPYLLDVALDDGYDDDGQRLLATWDFGQPADSAAAAYYNVVWRDLLAMTFHDELPEELWPDGGTRWMAALPAILEDARNPWWDDLATEGVVETRDDVLRAALLQARDDLTSMVGPDPDDWTWGALHRLELRSSTLGESGIGVVERLFNRGGWEAAGGSSIVNATGWDAAEGFEVVTAPSMRMLVDLADLDASRWINLTGVSGHAFHPHQTDQTDLMVAGETLPWAFSRSAVDAAGEDVLTLVPPPAE
ncbi:penicillin acylase family protein [Nocardioides sp. 1609]|uniref:penicillin acylase family protein n=1 Tax=Nocardioides sp. 1609 TaxID=2508327 RepID=UPI00106FB220|nr:penicillin acylase family protein [Nocardioides sp. 1609]